MRRTGMAGLSLGLVVVSVAAVLGQERGGADAPGTADAAAPAAQAEAIDASPEACRTCHEPVFPRFENTAHSQLGDCAICHGDVGSHVAAELAGEGKGAIVDPRKLSAKDSTALCQGCHDRGRPARFAGGLPAPSVRPRARRRPRPTRRRQRSAPPPRSPSRSSACAATRRPAPGTTSPSTGRRTSSSPAGSSRSSWC